MRDGSGVWLSCGGMAKGEVENYMYALIPNFRVALELGVYKPFFLPFLLSSHYFPQILLFPKQ